MMCAIPGCPRVAVYRVAVFLDGVVTMDARPLCRPHTDSCVGVISEIAHDGDLWARVERIGIPR